MLQCSFTPASVPLSNLNSTNIDLSPILTVLSNHHRYNSTFINDLSRGTFQQIRIAANNNDKMKEFHSGIPFLMNGNKNGIPEMRTIDLDEFEIQHNNIERRKCELREQTNDESMIAAMYAQLNSPNGTASDAMITTSAFSPSIEQESNQQLSFQNHLSVLQNQFSSLRNQASFRNSLLTSPFFNCCLIPSCKYLFTTDNINNSNCSNQSQQLPTSSRTSSLDDNIQVPIQPLLNQSIKSDQLQSPLSQNEKMHHPTTFSQQVLLLFAFYKNCKIFDF